jgi:hypothetical protein
VCTGKKLTENTGDIDIAILESKECQTATVKAIQAAAGNLGLSCTAPTTRLDVTSLTVGDRAVDVVYLGEGSSLAGYFMTDVFGLLGINVAGDLVKLDKDLGPPLDVIVEHVADRRFQVVTPRAGSLPRIRKLTTSGWTLDPGNVSEAIKKLLSELPIAEQATSDQEIQRRLLTVLAQAASERTAFGLNLHVAALETGAHAHLQEFIHHCGGVERVLGILNADGPEATLAAVRKDQVQVEDTPDIGGRVYVNVQKVPLKDAMQLSDEQKKSSYDHRRSKSLLRGMEVAEKYKDLLVRVLEVGEEGESSRQGAHARGTAGGGHLSTKLWNRAKESEHIGVCAVPPLPNGKKDEKKQPLSNS